MRRFILDRIKMYRGDNVILKIEESVGIAPVYSTIDDLLPLENFLNSKPEPDDLQLLSVLAEHVLNKILTIPNDMADYIFVTAKKQFRVIRKLSDANKNWLQCIYWNHLDALSKRNGVTANDPLLQSGAKDLRKEIAALKAEVFEANNRSDEIKDRARIALCHYIVSNSQGDDKYFIALKLCVFINSKKDGILEKIYKNAIKAEYRVSEYKGVERLRNLPPIRTIFPTGRLGELVQICCALFDSTNYDNPFQNKYAVHQLVTSSESAKCCTLEQLTQIKIRPEIQVSNKQRLCNASQKRNAMVPTDPKNNMKIMCCPYYKL